MNTGEAVLAYLASYQLKAEGPGKWRCNSPLRPGSNSHAFTLKIESDGEHGAWDDHAGGEAGSLYNLAERLGIATPKARSERPTVGDSKRVYKNLAEYATFKGVPEEIFLHAKWSSEPVTFDKRPALQFPTQGGTRYRFVDGEKPAFKSETGYKACWYGLKAAAEFARSNAYPLVLCNGEPSVIVALHFKVPACAITGGEQPTIPAALLQELKATWGGPIWIALDCDAAGRKSAAGKASILQAAGFAVTVIDLGLSEKGDLADFCKLHTDSSMSALQQLAQNSSESHQEASNSSAAPQLAQLIKELTNARKLNVSSDSATLADLLDRLQAELDHSRITVQGKAVQSFAHLVSLRHKRLDEARKHPDPVQGLRSHIPQLDRLIGGFVPGRVHTFYGDTGMGKSTTVASIVAQFAGQAAGFIIPTESMPGDYLDKLVAYKAQVPFDLIETGQVNDQQYKTIMAAYSWLEEKNCHFLDSLQPTAATIGSAVRDGIKAYNYQWVLIDSINNLTSVLHDDLYGVTSEAADFAQELARLGLVVLITSQVGRNLKNRKKSKMPTLNDALGSGRIEQNSDVVISLYNHAYYVERDEMKPNDKFPPGLLFARCLKHRWRGGQVNRGAFITFKGGVGVFE